MINDPGPKSATPTNLHSHAICMASTCMYGVWVLSTTDC